MNASLSLDQLLEEVVTLPSLPSTVAKITSLVNDPNASLNEVGQAIAEDAALAAKTLRLVNSAFFAVREKVTSVEHAVAMLGMKVIKNVVFTATVFETLDSGQERLVRHNVACGVAMSALMDSGVTTTSGTSDEAFLFGLLHDLGKLILGEFMPEETSAVQIACSTRGISASVAEREIIGVDHAEVGARLAQNWKLPDTLIQAIAGHHDLERCESPEHRDTAALLAIADFITYKAGMGAQEDCMAVVAPEMWAQVNLDVDLIEPVVQSVVTAEPSVDELVGLCK